MCDPLPQVPSYSHHTMAQSTGDPLENSNLCDILMLERALETEAHVSRHHLQQISPAKEASRLGTITVV